MQLGARTNLRMTVKQSNSANLRTYIDCVLGKSAHIAGHKTKWRPKVIEGEEKEVGVSACRKNYIQCYITTRGVLSKSSANAVIAKDLVLAAPIIPLKTSTGLAASVSIPQQANDSTRLRARLASGS